MITRLYLLLQKIIKDPILRSNVIFILILIIGISGMTLFAYKATMEEKSRIREIDYLYELNQDLGIFAHYLNTTLSFKNSDASQFHGVFNSRDFGRVVKVLNCLLLPAVEMNCPFRSLRIYLKKYREYPLLAKEWKTLSENQNLNYNNLVYHSDVRRAFTNFLLKFQQFIQNKLDALFLQSEATGNRFQLITLLVWIGGIVLLITLGIANAVPGLRYTREIEDAQNHLQRLFDSSPAGIVVVDRLGKILEVNPAAATILEGDPHKQDKIMGRYFHSFLDAQSIKLFSQFLTQLESREEQTPCQVEIALPGENNRFLNLYGIQYHREGVPLCQLAFIDITEKKATEEKIKRYLQKLESKFARQVLHIREMEQRYKDLFEYTPAGMFLFDATGKVVQANARAKELFAKIGWDIENGSFSEVWGTELRLANLKQRLGNKTALMNEEVKLYLENGQSIYLSVFFTPFHLQGEMEKGYLCTFFDITEQVQLKNELTQLNNYFQTIFNNTTDGIIVYDTQNKIIDVNERICELSGFSREELLGRECFHLMCGTDRSHPEYECLIKQILNREPLKPHTLRLYRKNGQIWVAESDGSLLYDEKGHVWGVIQILRDVTQRVEAEEREKQLAEQLRQSQKMEIIGQLAGGIAHDFNNILTVIRGFADFALMMLPPQNPSRNYIEKIIEGTESAAHLTSQLLSFSRRKLLKLEVIELNQVVQQSVDFVKRLLGERILINLNLTSDKTTVKLDRTAIQQIITNLCINARDAMPDGGTLTISTAVRVFKAKYSLWEEEITPGQYVMLSIKDTGVGIPKEILPRIFEPFFTTKKQGKGTGLGLSMVYGLIKQHNGIITVYSEEGVGTEFKIYLPLTEENPGKGERKTTSIQLQGSGVILVAEDEPLVLEVIESSLKKYGYTVISARNGKEAWEIFQKEPEKIDLLIFDAIMPELDGSALFERVKQMKPELPAICISGYSKEGIHQNYILREGLEYIEKPFSSEILVQKVSQILKSSQ